MRLVFKILDYLPNSYSSLKKFEEKDISSFKFLDSKSIFGLYFPLLQNSFHCVSCISKIGQQLN